MLRSTLRLAARNSATAAVIGGIGDALMQYRERSQLLSGSDQIYNPQRTANLCIYRAFHMPVIDVCWRQFDKVLPAGRIGVLLKIVADQGLLMPPSIAVFFLSQSVLEGMSWSGCWERTRDSFWPAVKICLPFWSVAHLVTFGFMRPNLRVPWAMSVAVLWNALLSEQNQLAVQREQS